MSLNKKTEFWDNVFSFTGGAIVGIILVLLLKKYNTEFLMGVFVGSFGFFSMLFLLILMCYRNFKADREKFINGLKALGKGLLIMTVPMSILAGYICFCIFILIPFLSKLSDNLETAAFWSGSNSAFLSSLSGFIDSGIFIILVLFPMLLGLVLFFISKRFFPIWSFIYSYASEESIYRSYLKNNDTQIKLFIRPSISKANMTFANKNCCITIDMVKLKKIRILDKIKKQEFIITCTIWNNRILPPQARKIILQFFVHEFDYETEAETLYKKLKNLYDMETTTKTVLHKQIYLDINSASEAELTAIPGITIAQAKHIAKVRREKHGLLTMGQFFKAAKLEEEFIEQIKTSGNKILLSELPEYKRIIMKENE